MYRTTLPLTHRLERDGSTVEYAHVPVFLAVEIACQAWAEALTETTGGLLNAWDVMAANLTSDYSRELLVGDADFEITAPKIGRSSIVLDVVVSQHGHHAAHLVFTMVRVVDGKSHPLDDAQREALTAL